MRGLTYISRSPPHSSGRPRGGTTWPSSRLRWRSQQSTWNQVAVDGGRHQLGWLLAGMPNPPFQLAQAHSQRAQRTRSGSLEPLETRAGSRRISPTYRGRGLRRAAREAGGKSAGCGPACSTAPRAKGKGKGRSEGSGQGRSRRRRRGSVEAGEPGACAAASDSRGAFRVRLSHEAAAQVFGPRGSAAFAAEPPPFSADADTLLFRFLFTSTQQSDQRAGAAEFDAIDLALSLRRRVLGALCWLAEFCRSSMEHFTADPRPSLGRDPWPWPPPDPLVDRGARSRGAAPGGGNLRLSGILLGSGSWF